MRINLTSQEIQDIRNIIQEYRNVSDELDVYQKKADEIQDKVIELNKNLLSIKEKENKKISELHKKYGDFGLQDIYDTLLADELVK